MCKYVQDQSRKNQAQALETAQETEMDTTENKSRKRPAPVDTTDASQEENSPNSSPESKGSLTSEEIRKAENWQNYF